MTGSMHASFARPLLDGATWVTDASAKSIVFANMFSTKYSLPDAVYNEFTSLDDVSSVCAMSGFFSFTTQGCRTYLAELKC